MNIVLLEPEIPQNTGNIGRTCYSTGTRLHLIEPLGFRLTEKNLKRAGMDYWQKLNPMIYSSYEDFLKKNPNGRIWYATTKAQQTYSDVAYQENDFIMFGKESGGIPEEILVDHPQRCIRIPMIEEARSLNLATSCGIVLYESLRQQGFLSLGRTGSLHRLDW